MLSNATLHMLHLELALPCETFMYLMSSPDFPKSLPRRVLQWGLGSDLST